MGAIKTLLGIVILAAILVFGYWLYATYTAASTNDDIWAQINENMPDQLRKWSCEQMNGRLTEAEAPASCADVWKTAVSPEPEAAAPQTQVDPTPDATAETHAEAPAEPEAPITSEAPATSDVPAETTPPSSAGVPGNN